MDFHGMKAKEAHMLMNNLLAFSGERDMGLRRINAIHGYNRGTAIKQAIHERFQNHPMVEYMGCPAHNPGETVFLLKTA